MRIIIRKHTAALEMAQAILNVALMCTLSACLNAPAVILAVMRATCTPTLPRHMDTTCDKCMDTNPATSANTADAHGLHPSFMNDHYFRFQEHESLT